MDVGCYCVNAARLIFGEEPNLASAIWEYRPEFGVEIALGGVLRFPSARMATFDCGFTAYGQGYYMVVGSSGAIEVPAAFVPGTADTFVVLTNAQGRREERIPGVDHYMLEAEEFAGCLLEGRPSRYPVEDAVANMRAIDALKRSARAGGAGCDVR
jgi:predicted dehydrogenase